MTDIETAPAVIPAPGWRRAFVTIDRDGRSVSLDWFPLAGFAVSPALTDELVGEPVMPDQAPNWESAKGSYEPLMDPSGVIIWRGDVYANTADWFATWKADDKPDCKLAVERGLPPDFDPAAFRPSAKPAATKPPAVQPLRAVKR